MRRIAAVLVLLLTATTAQAGISANDAYRLLGFGTSCCFGVPLLLVIALAIYDWQKNRRPTPPEEDE